jgi:hypothetical protein
MPETISLRSYRRRDLPRIRIEWAGDQVRVAFITRRRQQSRRPHRIAQITGTLKDESPEQITLETSSGTRRIHYSRIMAVYNLSHRDYAEECRRGMHGKSCEGGHK